MDRSLLRKLAVHYIAPRYPLKPTSMSVSPTLRCSGRCVHCMVWTDKGRQKTELTPPQWRNILAHRFFNSVRLLWLTGGEPTLRDDLPQIALAAAESLPALESLTLSTNALDPAAVQKTLEEIMPQFERRGIYAHLHMSLDGPPEIHDIIRGIEGAFDALEQTVDIARHMHDKGMAIGFNFNCVIQKDNLDHLEQTLEAALKQGGSITFNLADMTESFYRSREGKSLERLDTEKILRFNETLLADSDPYHRRHYETMRAILMGRPRPYRCETLEATVYLDPDASMFPCARAYNSLYLDSNELSPPGAWRTLFGQRGRIRRELCTTCALGCSFGEGITLREFFNLISARPGATDKL